MLPAADYTNTVALTRNPSFVRLRSDRPQHVADRRAQEPEHRRRRHHPRSQDHWAEIKSGKVTYRIVGMPDRDFPEVPDHREASYTTLESAVLRDCLTADRRRRPGGR